MNSYQVQYYAVNKSINGYAIVSAHSPKSAAEVLCNLGCFADSGYEITCIKCTAPIQAPPNRIICEGYLASGANGKDGLSAYEIAVKHGFEGTEEEWLESLKATSSGSSDSDSSSSKKGSTIITTATKKWYYLNRSTDKYNEAEMSNDGDIDFVKGTRTQIKNLSSNEDIFLSTDKGTFITGGVEVGAYYPDESLTGKSSAIGGLPAMALSSLKGMTFSQLFDRILFPEADAFDNGYTLAQVVNKNRTLLVGTTLKTGVTISSPTVSTYGYVSTDDTYKSKSYVLLNWVSPALPEGNVIFGNNTSKILGTTYKIAGPTTDMLSNEKYLYGSRGTASLKIPSIVGDKDCTLLESSATVKGVYKLGVNESLVDYYQDADGYFSSELEGDYTDSLKLPIRIDDTIGNSYLFEGATIQVPIKSIEGKTLQVTLSGEIYTPGTGYAASTKLTDALTSATKIISSQSSLIPTIKDANSTMYSVYTVTITVPSDKLSQTLGLLKIYANLKFS